MDKKLQSTYINVYPDSRKLFSKIDRQSKTDKARAQKLLEITDADICNLYNKIQEINARTEPIDNNVKDKLIAMICEKMQSFNQVKTEYFKVIEDAKTSESSRKQEQRMRAQVEDKVMTSWMETHWLTTEVKKGLQHMIGYYDTSINEWNFNQHRIHTNIAITPKIRFTEQDAIEINDRAHWEEIEEETRFKVSAIQAYTKQRRQLGDRLSNDELRWIEKRYNDGYIDLSSRDCDMQEVYLAKRKASDFKERWGMSELEADFYNFVMPYEMASVPDIIFFNSMPGEQRELILFYDANRLYSHTEIKEQVVNGSEYIRLIELHHKCGCLIKSNGKYKLEKLLEPSPYPCEKRYDGYRGYAYLYTKRKEEQEKAERDKYLEQRDKDYNQAKVMGLSISEYDTMKKCYVVYKEDVKTGKSGNMPKGLSFRDYCAYRYYGQGHQWYNPDNAKFLANSDLI